MTAEVGLLINLTFFGALWTVVSVFVDKLVPIFNSSCLMINCFEDGVQAFGMLMTIWMILPVIVVIVLLINYFITKQNQATQNQVI
jgi:hypothetical protein